MLQGLMDTYADMKKHVFTKMNKMEKCSICLEKMIFPYELSCGHKFHRSCWSKWATITNSCPICRKKQCIWYRISLYSIKEFIQCLNEFVIEYHECIYGFRVE